ncbi:3-hydroxyacyl-ACP dehydratase [candidate division WOR_3 bacterium SM23_42]|uniref:3-hydroxyacyl-ACP dehydratase n=1 Tax=candidate division WOR_3 bacterium SM23_42 TaxID=1703779 RepID=A0A0S8FVY9_UNCW3|nr:MAG: 3-hydroxyacyl-ACP dehydratase [candidate division WOR_3 bacterium SM23_42]
MTNHEQMWNELGMDVELHKELLRSIDKTFNQTVGAQKNRPAGIDYFDHVLHESHGGRVAELIEARKNGKKFIGTFCIYVPDEIAMAADAIPVALCGGSQFSIPYGEKMFPRDICPLIKSTMGLALGKICPYGPIKDLGVGETTCDAKKKTWDVVNFHVMEVPQKKSKLDFDLWFKAIEEFKDKVEELTGKKVEARRLSETIAIMNQKRRALQKLNEMRKIDPPPISGLDALVVMQAALNDEPVRFTEYLNKLNHELEKRADEGFSPFPKGTKRIMISGCPSVMGNWKVHSLIEKSNASVVIDETCTGTRYFENLVDDQTRTIEQQLNALAERYMKINCSCFTPNNERLESIEKIINTYRVDGVVQYILQYCHGYNVEAMRVSQILKQANLPNLKIVTDYSEEDTGQLQTRIDAFLEQIE